MESRPAIPGERICFVLDVEDRDQSNGAPTITAAGDGLTIDSISTPPPGSDDLIELWVTIEPTSVETVAHLTVTAGESNDAGGDWVETRSILVTPVADDRREASQAYFDRWIEWLARNRPELGITSATEWDPMYVSPLWIVSKYAFWSDEWEMVVAWHIMVPPDDFTEVYLRRRWDDLDYSLAFRQDSFANDSEPRAIEPSPLIR
jgi:hypothetical protein